MFNIKVLHNFHKPAVETAGADLCGVTSYKHCFCSRTDKARINQSAHLFYHCHEGITT